MRDAALIRFPTADTPSAAVYNDLGFDGDLETLTGHDRRLQDVVVGFMQAYGSDPIYPTTGSRLPLLVGHAQPQQNPMTSSNLQTAVQQAVVESLAFVAAIDVSTSPDEVITGIPLLQVSQPEPDQFFADVVISLADGSTLAYSQPLTGVR